MSLFSMLLGRTGRWPHKNSLDSAVPVISKSQEQYLARQSIWDAAIAPLKDLEWFEIPLVNHRNGEAFEFSSTLRVEYDRDKTIKTVYFDDCSRWENVPDCLQSGYFSRCRTTVSPDYDTRLIESDNYFVLVSEKHGPGKYESHITQLTVYQKSRPSHIESPAVTE